VTLSSGLDRLAASVLCVGFDGATAQEAPRERLARLGPGGIVLFSRNVRSIAETRALVDAVRDAVAQPSGTVPFVAIDQEGGRVSRLRAGAHDVPPMMALGAAGDALLAERVGAILGADVRNAGGDVDFAPVLDLAATAQGTTIGERAFGDDPASVAELGAALIRGLQAQGVAATIKHFPGHGATAADSHLEVPVVDADAATLRARDLVPFVHGIAAGARAVMSAHVLFRALDPEHPATLSHRILTDLLRMELGFTGVCFTDCLEMDAIARGAGTERGAVMALGAGVDCVTISHRLDVAELAHAAIVDAVRSGVLAQARLEQAAARAATLRCASVGAGWAVLDPNAGAQVARSAITILRAERLAGVRVHEPVTVVSFEAATSEGAQGTHSDHPALSLALRHRHVHAELLRVPLAPNSDMLEQLTSVIAAQPEHEIVVLMRRAHVNDAQRAAVAGVLTVAPDAILVSMREPFDAALFPQARTVLCTFGDGTVSVDALADVLVGRADATGRLPVRLQ
jgi:beta-N-acetylhexosaminidase